MREYDRAIGRIASCCSAVNASYRGFRNQRGQQIIEIKYRNGIFSIVTDPEDSYFRALAARQLSNVEGFDLTQSQPIVDVDDHLSELFDDVKTANIRIDSLVETDEATGVEYFDGFRTIKPLYVYDEAFGPQTFDESLAELNQIGRKAFNRALDDLGIDLEHVEEATGGEEEPQEAYTRAFQ